MIFPQQWVRQFRMQNETRARQAPHEDKDRILQPRKTALPQGLRVVLPRAAPYACQWLYRSPDMPNVRTGESLGAPFPEFDLLLGHPYRAIRWFVQCQGMENDVFDQVRGDIGPAYARQVTLNFMPFRAVH